MSKLEDANLITVKDPKFLSLVKRPANQVGFRILRSDVNGDPTMNTPIVRRARRSDPSPILQVTYPAGTTDEAVTESLVKFGLTGYKVTRSDAGVVTALRADLKSVATQGVANIKLTADGIVATVLRADQPQNPKSEIAIVSYAFRADVFDTPEKVTEWLRANDPEQAELAPIAQAEGTGDFLLQRSELSQDEETRIVDLGDGVRAVIKRDDAQAIPAVLVNLVTGAAYGNWGWGHLDFLSSMADEEFSEAMEDATYRLRDVLRNILLYSSLPLDERKTLAANALKQFGDYMAAVLDSLPRQVMVAVARSEKPNPKELPMSTTPAGEQATKPTATTSAPAADTLTRADIQQMITDGVAAALAAVKPAEVARSEPAPAEPAAAPAATAAPAAAPVVEETLTRADVSKAVADAVAPLAETIKQLSGASVVRSDTPDPAAAKPDAVEKDVFRNAPVFAGLRGVLPSK